jgi:thioredoxin reductase
MGGTTGRRFTYGRRALVAPEGTTLLDALAREEVPTLGRSLRYHRPRAPICGIGQCSGCLVRVNDRPNVRACRHLVGDGDRAEGQNAWPSPRFDLGGAIDTIFSGGIDTQHGFRRPAWATGLYQRVVRHLAGYGPPPTAEASGSLAGPPDQRTADVVIIGAGASGRAAAERLVELGRRPLLLERGFTPGAVPGADLLAATTATFLPPPVAGGERPFTILGFTEPARGVLVQARTVVVAAGGYDASLLFGGNDRPGVMTADLASAFTAAGRSPPFHEAVLVGGGDRARDMIERLDGVVGGVIAPGEISPELTRAASDRGIPLYPRSLVLGTRGRGRVHGVAARSRGNGSLFTLPCDAVVLAHRRLPNPQLFFQAGARMHWRSGAAAYFPVLDPTGATTVPGLFAVGDAAGILPKFAAESGALAAERIAGRPTPAEAPPRTPEAGPFELEGYYRELLRQPRRGRWIACPCEDVLLEEVEDASRAGYRGIEVVKRYSNLGTGTCQGRYCLPDALLLLSILEGRPPEEVGYITQRPPVVPTPLAALAALETSPPVDAA